MMKIFLFISLLSIACLSSCSYQFYPQRVDVFCFDSARQTKTVIEPYFNTANFHLGVAHSFSKHLFFNISAQADLGIPFTSLFNSNSSNGLSAGGGLGYYKWQNEEFGFQLAGAFDFEKVKSKFIDGWYDGNDYNDVIKSSEFSMLIPSVQPAIFLKGSHSVFSFACKTSLLFQQGTTSRSYYDNGGHQIKYTYFPNFTARSFLVQPSIQLTNYQTAITIFFGGSISLIEGDDQFFAPIINGGIKFILHYPNNAAKNVNTED